MVTEEYTVHRTFCDETKDVGLYLAIDGGRVAPDIYRRGKEIVDGRPGKSEQTHAMLPSRSKPND